MANNERATRHLTYRDVTITVFKRGSGLTSDFAYSTSVGVWGAGQQSADEAEADAKLALDRRGANTSERKTG